MDFSLLGSLEVREDGVALDFGGLRERSLLAILLLNANELVPTDRLVDELWGDEPPKAAVKTVQVYVSRLRKLIGTDAIITRAPGYELRVAPERIDAGRFERLAAEGRRALREGDAQLASSRLEDALALWRGAPLSDFAYERFAQPHAARLEELRLTALEDRFEAVLRCDRATEVVGELRALTARYPLRERLRSQLMLALYRSGRQADALDVYRDSRATLVEELGIEPGVELQRLEQAILRQDPSLEVPLSTPRSAGLLVGRSSQMGVLLAGLEAAVAGDGSVVLLAGEPGIGKSRLADEVAAHARDRGVAVLRGRCWEAGGAPPFWPWQQVLRAALRDSEGDLADLVPDTSIHDPEAQRFRLFDAVATSLRERAAAGRGILILLDDLHAADEPSLRLLEFLSGAIEAAPLMIVGAYRDTEPSRVAQLTRERSVRHIAVTALDRGDVGTYLALSTGRPVSAAVVEAVHARTAGNALFVAETARLLVSEGRLDTAAVAAAMPAGAREAIERRLEAISADAREALNIASVLGGDFAPDLLERVAADDDVGDALDEAIAAGLVQATPGAPGRLRFSHGLVRDTIYASLARRRRRDLHRTVAVELERRHAADPGPNLAALAHHLFEAALTEQAAQYATRAAEHAMERLAFEEAARLYRMALRAVERVDAADARRRCDLLLGLGEAQARSGDDTGARTTFLSAAEAARACGSGERLARAALGYSGRFVWTVMRGDPHVIPLLEEAIGALPPDDSELRARLVARLAAGPLKVRGDAARERRFALSAEAVAMARRLGDPAVLAWTLDGRKVAIWGPDTLEEHWATIAELRELAEDAGDPEQLVDAHICALIMGFERFELAGFQAAHASAGLAARTLRQPGQRWLVAVMAPMHALLVGRLAGAGRLIDEALELGREAVPWNARTSALLQRFVLRGLEGRAGDVADDLRAAVLENPDYPVFQAALATAYADRGAVEPARAAFEGLAVGHFAPVMLDEEWLLTMSLLADACAFLGDAPRAAILYERLEPYANRVAVGATEVALGSSARALGKLAVTSGETGAAAHWFEQAATENQRAGALPWAAHARLDHARLLLEQGDRGAERLIENASAIYRELGMSAWLARAQSLRAPLAAPAS